jgi:hypothetical protein
MLAGRSVKAHVVARQRSEHQVSWGQAFAKGLRRHGIEATVSEAPRPCDLLVLWGTHRQEAIVEQKARGGEICILERGYIGDRHQWTSVSFGGGLNNRATFRGPLDDPSGWERLFAGSMKPWRTPEGYALLIGQVPTDMSVRHIRIEGWYRATARQLSQAGWQVRFRPHPDAVRRGVVHQPMPDAPLLGGSLDDALAGAGLVVTFNSNTGVDAILAGCPVVTMDEGAMAWPVASHEIGIAMPCRQKWAQAMAWKQWSLEEIQSGVCWDSVRPH